MDKNEAVETHDMTWEEKQEDILARLQRETLPWLNALKQLHGEMDAIGVEEVPAQGTASQNGNKWDAIKERMAPRLREAIDLLLLQGTMKRAQVASALKMDYSNCTKNVIGVLIRQGWIVDRGGELSLKPL